LSPSDRRRAFVRSLERRSGVNSSTFAAHSTSRVFGRAKRGTIARLVLTTQSARRNIAATQVLKAPRASPLRMP
jgi:hypothetical protein